MTQPPVTPGYQSRQPGSGLAVASLVLGIISCVIFCFIWVSAPLGVLAIVLSVIATGQIRRGQASGAGMAKGGLILGIIGLVLSIAFFAAASAGVHFLGKSLQQKAQEIQQKAQQEQQRVEQEQRQREQQHPSTEPGT